MKKRLTKGERDFIKGCTKAILNNETDLHHWLFIVGGVKQYIYHKSEIYPENHPILKHAICICAIGKEFILDWHNKAGKDDFSKPWVKQSLEHLMANSYSFAEVIYRETGRINPLEDLDSINTEELSEKGKKEYLEKNSYPIGN